METSSAPTQIRTFNSHAKIKKGLKEVLGEKINLISEMRNSRRDGIPAVNLVFSNETDILEVSNILKGAGSPTMITNGLSKVAGLSVNEPNLEYLIYCSKK